MRALRVWHGGVLVAAGLLSSTAASALTPAGEDCNTPPGVQVDFTDADTTSGRVDNYDPSMGDTCPSQQGMGLATGLGPDLVYRVYPAIAGTVHVTMTPAASDDLALYVVSPTCTAGVFTMNCIVGDDNGGGGESEGVSFAATATTPYYVVVDGWNGQAGPFTITVTGLLSPLDVDGDGEVQALTDGLLTLRYHFGFTGATLVTGAIDLVNCTRCAPSDVQNYFIAMNDGL